MKMSYNIKPFFNFPHTMYVVRDDGLYLHQNGSWQITAGENACFTPSRQVEELIARTETFRITWRVEEGGSFYEQDYSTLEGFEDAFVNWSEFWGLDTSDCFVWKVEKI